MRVGVTLPSFGPLSLVPGAVALARAAEEAGADALWVPDHLCVPRERSTPYPGSADGALPFPEDAAWLDCLTALAAVAGATSRIRLGTAILVLTQRNPLEVAKVASSLDRISGGRLTMGVGAGWLKEEIRALGYEPRGRGRRLDEAIHVLRDCWTGETRGFDGDALAVERGLIFQPTPAQATLPILVGGKGERALRRAAELGDGWIPDADIDLLDFDALARGKAAIAAQRRAAGRDGAPFQHVLVVDAPADRVDALPDVARRASALGFDEVVIEVPFEDPARVRAAVSAVRAAAATS